MGANVYVEFENLGATNYFGIEKISYFGNYMGPWSSLGVKQY